MHVSNVNQHASMVLLIPSYLLTSSLKSRWSATFGYFTLVTGITKNNGNWKLWIEDHREEIQPTNVPKHRLRYGLLRRNSHSITATTQHQQDFVSLRGKKFRPLGLTLRLWKRHCLVTKWFLDRTHDSDFALVCFKKSQLCAKVAATCWF